MADLDKPSPDENGTPRWVKITGLITFAIVILIIAAMFLFSGGKKHGPGMHQGLPSANAPRSSISTIAP